MTRDQFEIALDTGRVRVRMSNGNLWSCRRNGRTQTWKTRPNDFRIPIKYGFKEYGQVTQDSINSPEIVIV